MKQSIFSYYLMFFMLTHMTKHAAVSYVQQVNPISNQLETKHKVSSPEMTMTHQSKNSSNDDAKLLDDTLSTFLSSFKKYEKDIAVTHGENAYSMGYYYCRANKLDVKKLHYNLLLYDNIVVNMFTKYKEHGGEIPVLVNYLVAKHFYKNLNKQQILNLREVELYNKFQYAHDMETCNIVDSLSSVSTHYQESLRLYLQASIIGSFLSCLTCLPTFMTQFIRKCLPTRDYIDFGLAITGMWALMWRLLTAMPFKKNTTYDKENKEFGHVADFAFLTRVGIVSYYFISNFEYHPKVLLNTLMPIIGFLALYKRNCSWKVPPATFHYKIKQVEFMQNLSPYLKQKKQKELAYIFPKPITKIILDFIGDFFSFDDWNQLAQVSQLGMIQYKKEVEEIGVVPYVKNIKKRPSTRYIRGLLLLQSIIWLSYWWPFCKRLIAKLFTI